MLFAVEGFVQFYILFFFFLSYPSGVRLSTCDCTAGEGECSDVFDVLHDVADYLLAWEVDKKKKSPPAKSQNPSLPLHPTTDKLGFSGCLEQSVVTSNPVVGQSTGVHNQSNDDLFRQMEKCMCFHGN